MTKAATALTTHEQKQLLAVACRVMAHTGLTPTVLGHISLRTGPDTLLIRCRGPRETGLANTTVSDVHEVGLDGSHASDEWDPPNELPLHLEVLRARPDVSVVVHAHPAAVVATTIAGVPLQPIVGAYDITASKLAGAGIPMWPRAALVNDSHLGAQVAAALADAPLALLYGHGLVAVGRGAPELAVAEAVVNSVAVDSLARMTLTVRSLGVIPTPIRAEDSAQLPDLGPGLNVVTMWRHLRAASGCIAAGEQTSP